MTGKENRYDRWSHDGAPSGDDARRIQEGINAAMRETIKNPPNPNALRRPEKVGVANAPRVVDADEPKRGTGWQEEKPLEPVVKPGSMEERVMSNLIDQALPPGGEKRDRK
jgi:hypothetical protein